MVKPNIQERQGKNGKTYRATVEVSRSVDENGKIARQRDTRTFDTEKEAKAWVKTRQTQAEADKRAFVEPSKETLAPFLDRWLEDKERQGLKPTTLQGYGISLRLHIRPHLGNIRLAELSPTAVQCALDKVAKGHGPRTVAYARSVLRIALQDAVRLGAIAVNPVDRTRPPKQTPRKVAAFDEAELERLFDAAKGTRLEHLLSFLAYSGLRRGEALALTLEDVDLTKGILNVGKNLVPLSGDRHHLQTPKSAAGFRVITLPAPALEALKGQRELQLGDKKAALAAGKPYKNDGFIFTTETGGLLDPNNVTRDFRRLRDKAGLRKDVPLHGLRHTAVSLQIAAGVPLEIVSKRIGHKKSGFTADVYGHLLPAMDKAAVDKLDAYLARKKPGEALPKK